MARFGVAWFGSAWPGLAWLGLAWPGLAWLGPAWLGLAWLGVRCRNQNHAKLIYFTNTQDSANIPHSSTSEKVSGVVPSVPSHGLALPPVVWPFLSRGWPFHLRDLALLSLGLALPSQGVGPSFWGFSLPSRGLVFSRFGPSFGLLGFGPSFWGFASGLALLSRARPFLPSLWLALPSLWLAFPSQGLALPARGLALPARCLALPARGLALPSQGVWPFLLGVGSSFSDLFFFGRFGPSLSLLLFLNQIFVKLQIKLICHCY